MHLIKVCTWLRIKAFQQRIIFQGWVTSVNSYEVYTTFPSVLLTFTIVLHRRPFCIRDLLTSVIVLIWCSFFLERLSFVLQFGLFILFSVVYFVIETVNLYNDHRSFFNFNMFYEYIVCFAKLYFVPYPPPIVEGVSLFSSPTRWNSLRLWPSEVCKQDHRRRQGEWFLVKHNPETIFHQIWTEVQSMT